MPLDRVLREFKDGATARAYLNGCGDETWLSRLLENAAHFDEDLVEYVSGAVRRFSNAADSEEWLKLMTAVGGSDDPGRACLARILNWSQSRDAAELAHETCGCGKAGLGRGLA